MEKGTCKNPCINEKRHWMSSNIYAKSCLCNFCSLLKIWNLNDFSGVVGAFNCQGAGWCKVGKTNLIHDECPGTITGVIRTKDVDYLHKVTGDKWTGDAVIFSHLGGMLFFSCLSPFQNKIAFLGFSGRPLTLLLMGGYLQEKLSIFLRMSHCQ